MQLDVWLPRRSACGAEYNEYTNPAVLAARYGFAFPQTTAAEGNALGLAEFQGQYYDTGDLEAFSTACGLAQTINVSKTTGGNMPSICSGGGEACVESLLDIEYAGAIAGAIPLEVYYSSSYRTRRRKSRGLPARAFSAGTRSSTGPTRSSPRTTRRRSIPSRTATTRRSRRAPPSWSRSTRRS